MHSQPLPRTSPIPSQPPFSHCLSLLLPFFSIPFSIAAFKGFGSCLLIRAVLVQVCPQGQEKKKRGVFLVGLCCSPEKSQEIFWRAKLQDGSTPCPQEVGKNTQKRKVHQVQAELVQLWMGGSNDHALGRERRNKIFLPTVSVPCN